MIDFQISVHESLGSTQDECARLAREGAAEGSVVQAREMTTGRGRHGRVWHAPRGNLYLSILLRPDENVQRAAQVSFVAAVAAAEAITPLMQNTESLQLKWPNDVLIQERKCCGILLESELDQNQQLTGLILGIGINISSAPEGTTTLHEAAKREAGTLDADMVRDHLLAALAQKYEIWKSEGFSLIREAWLARAFRLGQEISVKYGRDQVNGIFEGLDGDGVLMLKTGNKLLKIPAGDVFWENS